MTYDSLCPERLKNTQEWFAAVSSSPLDLDEHIQGLSPAEAAQWIRPSPTLRPVQRMEIYNQQYWWRVLRALRENYPLSTRLFGSKNFDLQIGVPYLQERPSQHWSLEKLGEDLPDWLEKSYEGKDKQLVIDVSAVDCAIARSFLAGELPPLKPQDPELSSQRISLQPSLQLLVLRAELFSWREEMTAQSEDYYIDRPFPPLEREGAGAYLIYRNRELRVAWQKISPAAYSLLTKLKKGSTLDEACEAARDWEKELENTIAFYFQEWTMRGWLCLESTK